jgi:hypothetical protein
MVARRLTSIFLARGQWQVEPALDSRKAGSKFTRVVTLQELSKHDS